MTSSSSSSGAATPQAGSADKLASLFGDPAESTARPWWRRHRRVGIVLVAIVVAAVGVFATDAFGSSGNSYRTAIVANHDVDSLLTSVATIEPVSQATVAFPVSGTVSAVNVAAGDQVAVGQALASLDPQSLVETLHTKEAALAQAKLTLSRALSGQSVTGAGGAGAGSAGSGSAGNGSATLSSASTGTGATAVLTAATPADPQLAAAQQAVLAAQQNVDTALAAAKTALDNATTVCAAAGAGASSTTTTAGTPGSTTGSGAAAQDAGLTACQTALGNVLTAQNDVATAQHHLADASTTLDNLLAQRAATPPATTPTTTAPSSGSGATRSGSGSTGSTGSTGSAGGGFGASSASSAPSSADLASYQAAVDAANVAVAAAYQALAQATIASPIQGTVVAVNLTTGASVTAASTTANVVVQGAGGFEVTTSVSVSNVSQVAVGQSATVVPDGSHRSLPGKVISISVAPTSSSSATTNYRVVVGLNDPETKLGNGSTGTVTITTKSAQAALAVPTSAITSLGRRYTVNVLDGDTPSTVVVGVGVVGPEWTQITSGLKSGQHVVIADLSSPLPSSATASSTGTNGTPNGSNFRFPGGGTFRIPDGRPGG
jgi:HlyD family secretion protein